MFHPWTERVWTEPLEASLLLVVRDCLAGTLQVTLQ